MATVAPSSPGSSPWNALLAGVAIVAALLAVATASRTTQPPQFGFDRSAFTGTPAPILPFQGESPPSACHLSTTERVVAVGDVHGDYDDFAAILRHANLIDGDGRWAGGAAVLVQTGDVLDRGPHSRRALELLQRLEVEAAAAGGAVHALLGNHEVMRMIGDLSDTSDAEYAAFTTPESNTVRERFYETVLKRESTRAQTAGRRFDEAALRRQFLAVIDPGFVEMQMAFEADGQYGKWLRAHNTVVRINDVVFVHGGFTRAAAELGCEVINSRVRADLRAIGQPDGPEPGRSLSLIADGPHWYRGLALDNSGVTATEVDAVLAALGARTIVVGHTVSPNSRIRERFDGRVVQIDTGMLGGSFFPGGRPSALEIREGVFTAIYADQRQVVFARPAESTRPLPN